MATLKENWNATKNTITGIGSVVLPTGKYGKWIWSAAGVTALTLAVASTATPVMPIAGQFAQAIGEGGEIVGNIASAIADEVPGAIKNGYAAVEAAAQIAPT